MVVEARKRAVGDVWGEAGVAIFAGEGGLVRETLLGVGKHLGKDLNLENKSIPGGAREKHPRPREQQMQKL